MASKCPPRSSLPSTHLSQWIQPLLLPVPPAPQVAIFQLGILSNLSSNIMRFSTFFFGKLSHFHRTAVEGRWADALLESMDAASRAIARQEEGPARTSRLARMMAATADLLGAMARGCGGLRSGPAHNQTFSPALALVEAGRLEEGLEGLMRAREGWLAEPRLLVRLARHYEGAVQALVRQTVLSAREQVGSPERAIVS